MREWWEVTRFKGERQWWGWMWHRPSVCAGSEHNAGTWQVGYRLAGDRNVPIVASGSLRN